MLETIAFIILTWPAFWYGSIFVFGAAFGSFLNVVVYRLPRGMSLSRPSSHCPRCKHTIRWWHNLPIVGWLLLGGKCYDCKLPIPLRYPVVELSTALLWAISAKLIALVVPYASVSFDATTGEVFYVFHSEVFFGWLALASLLTGVLGAILIRVDGQRVPLSLLVWNLVSAGVAVLCLIKRV
jgi:prepilin signal peptidase PulO-like enzyme (type II secretory pathway)